MGADICGWVEISKDGKEWQSAIRIQEIVYRQYGMFASLFGIRNGGPEGTPDGRFKAIAPGRGAAPQPAELYWNERENYGGAVGETWVLYSELAAVDWDEEGSLYIDEEDYVRVQPAPGCRRERRGDYLNGGWATLLRLMECLADQFGADHVRLAVWFDQW